MNEFLPMPIIDAVVQNRLWILKNQNELNKFIPSELHAQGNLLPAEAGAPSVTFSGTVLR